APGGRRGSRVPAASRAPIGARTGSAWCSVRGRAHLDIWARRAVPRSDLTGGCAVRARQWDEQRLAVVLQFLDAVDDVGECAMAAVLDRRVVVHARVPAPGELLDRGHVDQAVVQVAV